MEIITINYEYSTTDTNKRSFNLHQYVIIPPESYANVHTPPHSVAYSHEQNKNTAIILRQIADILRPFIEAESKNVPHFSFCAYNEQQLKTILQVLKDEKQIAAETIEADFLYFCSFGHKAPSVLKIRWTGQIGTLAHFIDDAFDGVQSKFKIAAQVFTADREIKERALFDAKTKGTGADKYDRLRNIFTQKIKHEVV